MKRSISLLKASAATIALSALAAPGAMAFDELNWTWNKTIEEVVTKNININADINPTGMTEVQKLQIQVGDVSATSEVSDIVNNQPVDGGGAGSITINETFIVDTFEDEDSLGDDIPGLGPIEGDDPANGIQATFNGGEIIEIDDADDEVILSFTIDGEVPFQVGEIPPLDAVTELPTVESVATAVGNNQSLESAVSTQLHEAQILFDVNDGFNDLSDEEIVAGLGGLAGISTLGNTFHQAGFATALGAAVGVIGKAEINALSTVNNITNARVDSSATAVGNNLSVDMSTAVGGDALLIADLTQVSVADVMATSLVSNVSLTNYANLGAESVNPIVSSVATAVGNNVNINVGVPSVE